jgi:hypothetical protein
VAQKGAQSCEALRNHQTTGKTIQRFGQTGHELAGSARPRSAHWRLTPITTPQLSRGFANRSDVRAAPLWPTSLASPWRNHSHPAENVVKEGEEVECKVLAVDAEAQRISLSLKAAVAKPEKADDKAKDKPEVEEPPASSPFPNAAGRSAAAPAKRAAASSSG